VREGKLGEVGGWITRDVRYLGQRECIAYFLEMTKTISNDKESVASLFSR
jgi:hypothetical protein